MPPPAPTSQMLLLESRVSATYTTQRLSGETSGAPIHVESDPMMRVKRGVIVGTEDRVLSWDQVVRLTEPRQMIATATLTGTPAADRTLGSFRGIFSCTSQF